MPLTLYLSRKDSVYVGGKKIVLSEITDAQEAVFKTEDGKQHIVTSDKMTEVTPDLRLSIGRQVNDGALRVIFDAHPSIPIVRGNLYESGTAGKSVTISENARQRFVELGKTEKSEMEKIVRLSTPYSSKFGNRRYEGFVLTVDAKMVVRDVQVVTETMEKQASAEENYY